MVTGAVVVVTGAVVVVTGAVVVVTRAVVVVTGAVVVVTGAVVVVTGAVVVVTGAVVVVTRAVVVVVAAVVLNPAKYLAIPCTSVTVVQPLPTMSLIVTTHAASLRGAQFLPPEPTAWIPLITMPWQVGQEFSASAKTAFALVVKPNAAVAKTADNIVLFIFINFSNWFNF